MASVLTEKVVQSTKKTARDNWPGCGLPQSRGGRMRGRAAGADSERRGGAEARLQLLRKGSGAAALDCPATGRASSPVFLRPRPGYCRGSPAARGRLASRSPADPGLHFRLS